MPSHGPPAPHMQPFLEASGPHSQQEAEQQEPEPVTVLQENLGPTSSSRKLSALSCHQSQTVCNTPAG